MKTKAQKTAGILGFILLFAAVALNLSSCKKNYDTKEESVKGINDLKIAPGFNFNTTQDITFSIYARDNQDSPIGGVRFDAYSADPEKGGILLFSGQTDKNGLFEFTRPIPTDLKEIMVTTKFLGIGRSRVVPISGDKLDVFFGGKAPNPVKTKGALSLTPVPGMSKVYYMGTFNSNGVPNYLESTNDVITAQDLLDINASLPEQQSVPVHHPAYLANTAPTMLSMIELCDVYVTFVSEGAGFKNAIGFYSYPTANPPTSLSQIDSIKVVFPNASSAGSGGGLYAGNKVKLGRYPAGVSIGWVVFANGWNGSNITSGNWTVYSANGLNPEASASLQRHIVLLRNPTQHNILFSIEDWRRDEGGCDNDFNDVVMNVVSNPVEAINTDDYPPMTPSQPDTDGDGVPDVSDDYPNDPTRCFDNYYPSKTGYASVVFEDLWPYRGDYDLNDLVISYRINQVTNSFNKVVESKNTFITEAMGAYLHNGFGFMMPVAYNKVSGVTGTSLQHGYIVNNANNTEAGQTKAVVVVYDDAYDRLPYPGTGIGVNTTMGAPYVTPDVMNVTVSFTTPVSIAELGTPPYNPFIIINGDRTKEVHLPDKPPTDKANQALFGTGDDNSNPATGRYYKTSTNLPWAFSIADKFQYPIEKIQVTDAYLKFAPWAESSGSLYPDWYKVNTPAYRDNTKIYTH